MQATESDERRRVTKLAAVYFALCILLVVAILPFLLFTDVLENSFRLMEEAGLEFRTSNLHAVKLLRAAPRRGPG
jgi:hypothetical protein